MHLKSNLIKYLFIIPGAIYMIAFVGYPLVYNIILSFQDVDLGALNSGDSKFIGFDNYKQLFSEGVFRKSVINTLVYTVGSIIFQFTIGFVLALFFSMKFKLANFLRGIVMVGWLIPLTVTALLFKFILDTDVGVVNQILMSLNIIDNPIGWLSSPKIALWSIILVNVWIGIPFNMLLLSTGLNDLPEDVYESASLDGASTWQKFIHLTLPMLRPVILVVMMLGFIYTFKVFDLVFVMTGGGPVDSTEVLSTLAYRYSFDDFQFSYGAAVANVLFLILFIISLIYLRMINKEEE